MFKAVLTATIVLFAANGTPYLVAYTLVAASAAYATLCAARFGWVAPTQEA